MGVRTEARLNIEQRPQQVTTLFDALRRPELGTPAVRRDKTDDTNASSDPGAKHRCRRTETMESPSAQDDDYANQRTGTNNKDWAVPDIALSWIACHCPRTLHVGRS